MLWSIADKNITSSKATYTAQKRRSGLKVASGCVWVAPDCVGVAAWAEVDADAPVCVGVAAWAEVDAGAAAGASALACFCVLIFLPSPASCVWLG